MNLRGKNQSSRNQVSPREEHGPHDAAREGGSALVTHQVQPMPIGDEELPIGHLRTRQVSGLRGHMRVSEQSRNTPSSRQLARLQQADQMGRYSSQEEIVELLPSKPSKRIRQSSVEPLSTPMQVHATSLPKVKMGRIANMTPADFDPVAQVRASKGGVLTEISLDYIDTSKISIDTSQANELDHDAPPNGPSTGKAVQLRPGDKKALQVTIKNMQLLKAQPSTTQNAALVGSSSKKHATQKPVQFSQNSLQYLN